MGNGGSQGSGAVSYPAYMETQHELWLDDVADLIDVYVDSSPYADEDAYDPATYLGYLQTDLDNYETKVDALDEVSKWTQFVQLMLSERSQIYPGVTSDIETIDSYAQGQATSYIDNILNGAEWEALVNRVRSEIVNIKSDATTEADSIISSSGSGGRDQVSSSDLTFDLMLRQRVGDMIVDAIDRVYGSGIDALVDEDVEAFEESALPEHNRSISRFAAQMCDIGAVHTSAFIIAQAQLEDQFEKSLRQRRAEVKERMVGAALQNYMQSYTQALIEYVKMSTPSGGDYVSAYFNSKSSDSNFILGAVDSILNKYKEEIAAKMQMYAASYGSYISGYIENEKFKSLYAVSAVEQLSNLLNRKLESDKTLVVLAEQIYKDMIIAEKEQTDRDLELAVLDQEYPFDLYKRGGDILASISGAASVVNRPTSGAQTALAGAAAGAAAMAPTANPALIGIGAGVGLLASLL